MLFRSGIGAQMLGVARGAWEYAAKYAQERTAFGKPIAEFQGIQFQIAQHDGRRETGNQNRGQHRRQYDVEQVVAGVQSGDSDHQHDGHVHDSDSGNVEVESIANASASDTAGEIRHRGQAHDHG